MITIVMIRSVRVLRLVCSQSLDTLRNGVDELPKEIKTLVWSMLDVHSLWRYARMTYTLFII